MGQLEQWRKVEWKEEEEEEYYREIGLETLEKGVEKEFFFFYSWMHPAFSAKELMIIVVKVLNAG